jgi:Family of unknown function (DUF5670)
MRPIGGRHYLWLCPASKSPLSDGYLQPGHSRALTFSGGKTMLWTIFVILLVLWLLGMVSSYTLGGFVHILLVLALVALVIQLISGRRAL